MKTHFLSLILVLCCFTSAAEREKMIIVCYHSFTGQLSEYIAAKARDNIDCIVIKVDSTDNFHSIKAKIDSVYNNFNADFLLLVGDNEHIPAYKIDEGLSDIHYTFENENNPIPRMIAGRFSIETEQDLQTIIERTLIRKPFSKHVIGIASGYESTLTQKKDYEQIQLMLEELESKGFTKVSKLFGGLQNDNPNYKDVIMSFQAGASWVNYAGYGSYEGWNTSGFENKYIENLPINVELPIIISASCFGGYFANRTCFAEKWLRTTKDGNPIGAVAVIMSSSFADWDATLSAMLVISEKMTNTDSNCRLGHLYLHAYNHIINNCQRYKDAHTWILFGDPSLWVYPVSANDVIRIEPQTLYEIIYPNPASNILHIVNSGIVNIYDVTGKLILTETFLSQNNKLDISYLTQGLYIISIQGENEIILRKLLICR